MGEERWSELLITLIMYVVVRSTATDDSFQFQNSSQRALTALENSEITLHANETAPPDRMDTYVDTGEEKYDQSDQERTSDGVLVSFDEPLDTQQASQGHTKATSNENESNESAATVAGCTQTTTHQNTFDIDTVAIDMDDQHDAEVLLGTHFRKRSMRMFQSQTWPPHVQRRMTHGNMMTVLKHAFKATKEEPPSYADEIAAFFEQRKLDGVMFAKMGQRGFANRLGRHCRVDHEAFLALHQSISQYPKFKKLTLSGKLDKSFKQEHTKESMCPCPCLGREVAGLIFEIEVSEREVSALKTTLRWKMTDTDNEDQLPVSQLRPLTVHVLEESGEAQGLSIDAQVLCVEITGKRD